MGKPNIIVEFKEKANSAMQRSERGVVCLILSDTTKTAQLTTYKTMADISETDWTPENLQIIRETMTDGANKLHIVRIGADETLADVKETLDSLKINWIAHIASAQTDIANYVKARNAAGGAAAIKAVVFNQAANDRHIVNFTNEMVVKADGTETAGYKYLGRIAGMLAALPLNRSATYYTFDDLKKVVEPENVDEAVEGGEFILFNDYGCVKVARAVNSATTVESEELKKITIVEGMDLMKEDITETFKNQYVGRFKNDLDNQMLFVAAINTYFRQLAADEVLNPDFSNLAEIDLERQRNALIAAGKLEAADWDDETVKKNPCGTYVYVKANVQMLDAIEDLSFDIYLA